MCCGLVGTVLNRQSSLGLPVGPLSIMTTSGSRTVDEAALGKLTVEKQCLFLMGIRFEGK